MEKEKQHKNNTLLIKNLYIASLLHSRGFRLVDAKSQKPNSRTIWFNFANRDEAERLLDEYWNGGVIVNLRAYLTSLDTLRDIIFSRSRGDGDEKVQPGVPRTGQKG